MRPPIHYSRITQRKKGQRRPGACTTQSVQPAHPSAQRENVRDHGGVKIIEEDWNLSSPRATEIRKRKSAARRGRASVQNFKKVPELPVAVKTKTATTNYREMWVGERHLSIIKFVIQCEIFGPTSKNRNNQRGERWQANLIVYKAQRARPQTGPHSQVRLIHYQ